MSRTTKELHAEAFRCAAILEMDGYGNSAVAIRELVLAHKDALRRIERIDKGWPDTALSLATQAVARVQDSYASDDDAGINPPARELAKAVFDALAAFITRPVTEEERLSCLSTDAVPKLPA